MRYLAISIAALLFSLAFSACDDFPVTPDKEDNPNIVNGVDTTFISSAFPYASKYVTVRGSQVHYIDEPATRGNKTFLLLHGVPTSTYLWRNVVPHLRSRGRVVAMDLIGFGLSDKPDIAYTPAQQLEYLTDFIEALNLHDITLVMHDAGGPLGLGYTAAHESNVKALVLMETLFRTFDSLEELPGPVQDFVGFYTMGEPGDDTPGSAWDAVVNQNAFVEGFIPQQTVRMLTDEELTVYRAPFATPESRLPIWQWSHNFPIRDVSDQFDFFKAGEDYLRESSLPKLLLVATPGNLISPVQDAFGQFSIAQDQLSNITITPIGEGLHFIQEDHPHTVGIEIAKWTDNL